MPISIQGPAWKGSSVPFGIIALSIPVLCYIVQSGDDAEARRLIDINDDGVMSTEEEKRAEDFLNSASPEDIEQSRQLKDMQRAITQMREERENPRKKYHYNEIY